MVSEKIKEMAEGAKTKMGDASDAVKEKAAAAKDKASEIKDSATGAGKEKGAEAKDKAGDLNEAVKEKGAEAKDKAGDMSEAAKQKAGDLTEAVKDKVGGLKEEIENGTDGDRLAEADPDKPKMRVVVLSSFGGLKYVKLGDRPGPGEPKATQVTVKVNMSGLNFQDLLVRLGTMENLPKTPFVLGTELIGTVCAVGCDVTKFKEGDLVFGLPENAGAWAEMINIDESNVWKVTCPEIGLEKLGSTMAYLIAEMLMERAAGSQLGEGSNIVVHSAGGSVGLALRDLAKLKKINVIGIASQSKFEKLEGLGFSKLIERGQDYVSEIKKLHPDGVDAVFDPQGGDDCARGISLLGPCGTYILFGSANIVSGETKSFFSLAKSWWQVEKVSPLKLMDENKTISGFNLKQLVKTNPEKVQKSLERVWCLMKDGTINPILDITYHMEHVVQAMQRMHDRKNVGKILLLPEPAIPTPKDDEAGGGSLASAKSESVDSNDASK